MLNEIKKIMKRNEFYFCFVVFFLAVIAEFIYKCYMYREVELSEVVSAYETHILDNVLQTPFVLAFSLILPMLVSVIASTIAYEEKKSNLIGCLYTRQSKEYYIKKQYRAVFVIAFSVVLFCLMISLFLSLITFPFQANFSALDYEYERFLHANQGFLFDYLYRLHPYINIIVFIVIRALYAGAFACFAYGISFIFKNKIIIIVAPFVFELFQEVALAVIGGITNNESISGTRIFSTNHYGNIWVIITIFLILMLIGTFGINKGIRVKDEL